MPGPLADDLGEAFDRHRDQLAVLATDATCTYGQLDAWSAEIAALLTDAPPPNPARVAVLGTYEAGTVALALGAVRAGRSFVPLDPTDPLERLADLVVRSGASTVVGTPAMQSVIDGLATRTGARPVPLPPIPSVPPAGAPVRSSGSARREGVDPGGSGGTGRSNGSGGRDPEATVLFTSGSTGRAKGVVHTQSSLLASARACQAAYGLVPSDRSLLVAPPAFAAAWSTIMPTLLSGAALVPVDVRARSTDRVLQRMRETGVTVVKGTVPVWRSLWNHPDAAHQLGSVREVIVSAGDLWARDVRLAWSVTPDVTLLTRMGSSETFGSANHHVTTADAHRQGPVPVGVPPEGVTLHIEPDGELWIASPSLALGYLDDPALTAERFVERDGTRWFRTGDLCTWDETDGGLHFRGRLGERVKLRGFTVEPAEVRARLLEVAGVGAAEVTVTGEVLVAVVEGDAGLDGSDVRAQLAASLPSHLVPNRVVVVDAIPRDSRGKTDRGALDALVTHTRSSPSPDGGRGALTRTHERAVQALFADVLGGGGTDGLGGVVATVGADDDFFDLGGTSLGLLELHTRVEEAFDVRIPIDELLATPTVAGVAAAVGTSRPDPRTDTTVLTLAAGTAGSAGNAGSPVFVLPGLAATGVLLLPVARALGCGRPVLSIEARGRSHRGWPDRTVEAMARRALASVRARQPEGPYVLAGYSGGALVAYEAARQLRAAGEAIELLVLLDYVPRREGQVRREPIVPVDWRTRPRRFVRRWARTAAAPVRLALPGRVQPDRVHRDELCFVTMVRAARRYRIEPLDVRALIAWSDDVTSPDAWSGLLPDATEVVHVPGTHHSMLYPPNVGVLAAHLDAALARAAVS